MDVLWRAVQRLVSRIVASDPARQRLRLALRGTLAMGGTVAAVAALDPLCGQPVFAAAPAVIVAMMTTLAIQDERLAGRLASMGLGVLGAMAGVAVGAALAGETTVSRIGFVALAGTAALAQGAGPRGMVTGMLAFISYFMAIFVHIAAGSLWFTAICVLCAAAISLLAKEVVIRDHPVEDLRRTIWAFAQRAGQAMRAIDAVARHGDDGPHGRLRRQLQRRLMDVRSTAMTVQGLLALPHDDASERAHDLILQITLAVEDLAEQAVRDRDRAELDASRLDLRALLAELAEVRRHALPDACVGEREDDGDGPDGDRPEGEGGDHGGDGDDADAADRGPRIPPFARKAAQATVACAVAVPVGLLISGTRWYWAALGAFVIFTRPSTAAESVQRGAQRVIGTTAGAAAGIAVGSAAQGSTIAQVVLLALAIFISLYAFALSYLLAMAGITTMLAILYDLMGRFSDQLLELRVIETAVGVAIGSVAALVVLPMSSRDKVRDAEEALLEEVGTFLRRARERLDGGDGDGGAAGLHEQAQAVERQAHQLTEVAEPLVRPLPGIGFRDRQRRIVLLASMGRSARQIATTLDRVDGHAGALRHDVEAVLRRIDDQRAGADDDGDHAPLRLSHDATPAAQALHRIGRVLNGLDEHRL